jgi:hypothetical protein
VSNSQQFIITARPSEIDPAERRRRLAAVYQILAEAAARATAAQGVGGDNDAHAI